MSPVFRTELSRRRICCGRAIARAVRSRAGRWLIPRIGRWPRSNGCAGCCVTKCCPLDARENFVILNGLRRIETFCRDVRPDHIHAVEPCFFFAPCKLSPIGELVIVMSRAKCLPTFRRLSTAPTTGPISTAPRSGALRRHTCAWIRANSRSAAANSSSRLRALSTARSWSRQTISRSPGKRSGADLLLPLCPRGRTGSRRAVRDGHPRGQGEVGAFSGEQCRITHLR